MSLVPRAGREDDDKDSVLLLLASTSSVTSCRDDNALELDNIMTLVQLILPDMSATVGG